MDYRDPHPSYASRHNPRAGSSRRPATISELAERANIPWDESKGFKHHLKLAEKYRREGKEYARSGDMENAFVEFAKAATLVLERLPKHPDYDTKFNFVQKHNLALNGQELLDNLADIKPGIVNRYEKWCQAHPNGVDEDTTPNVRTQQLAYDSAARERAQRESQIRDEEAGTVRQLEEQEGVAAAAAYGWFRERQRLEAESRRREMAGEFFNPPKVLPQPPDLTFSRPNMQMPVSGHRSPNTVVLMDGQGRGHADMSRSNQQEQQKLNEDRRGADEELKRTDIEIQRLVDEEERKRKEEEERRYEVRRKENVRRKEAEEARRKAEELSWKEAEAKRRLAQLEQDTERAKQIQLEAQRVAEEMKEREDILRWREAELMRRELDIFRREEEAKKEEETKRKEAARLEGARKAEVNRKLQAEEAEFRKRVERKRNGDDGARSGSSQDPPAQFNNALFIRRRSPGLSGTGPAPTRSPTIRPTSAPSLAVNRSANTSTETQTMGSVSSGTYSKSSSPHPALSPPSLLTKPREQSESDFRRMPESRQLEPAPRPLFPQELQQIFEYHETLWSRLKTLNELSWDDFPWPMAKQPSNPDDMSLSLISAYIQSPLYPHKSRTPKDRIKDHIRRWHPDSFEAKLLRKVVQNEKEKVKLGAGNVARYLSNLLEKENEKEDNNHFFGN